MIRCYTSIFMESAMATFRCATSFVLFPNICLFFSSDHDLFWIVLSMSHNMPPLN